MPMLIASIAPAHKTSVQTGCIRRMVPPLYCLSSGWRDVLKACTRDLGTQSREGKTALFGTDAGCLICVLEFPHARERRALSWRRRHSPQNPGGRGRNERQAGRKFLTEAALTGFDVRMHWLFSPPALAT